MSEAFAALGYAFAFGCALLALAWLWDKALTAIGRKAMETHEFFQLVVRYARERNKTRVMGIDE